MSKAAYAKLTIEERAELYDKDMKICAVCEDVKHQSQFKELDMGVMFGRGIISATCSDCRDNKRAIESLTKVAYNALGDKDNPKSFAAFRDGIRPHITAEMIELKVRILRFERKYKSKLKKHETS